MSTLNRLNMLADKLAKGQHYEYIDTGSFDEFFEQIEIPDYKTGKIRYFSAIVRVYWEYNDRKSSVEHARNLHALPLMVEEWDDDAQEAHMIMNLMHTPIVLGTTNLEPESETREHAYYILSAEKGEVIPNERADRLATIVADAAVDQYEKWIQEKFKEIEQRLADDGQAEYDARNP